MRSHERIRAALEHRGIEVTQATLSRDLREMGVVKTTSGYRLPEDLVAPLSPADTKPASSVIPQHVLDVTGAAGLVVLRTTPGSAGVVALELDRQPPEGVVGTVAGDDTVFVAVAERSAVARVAESLRRSVGLPAQAGSVPARGGAA